VAKKDAFNPFAELPAQLKLSTGALNVFRNAWSDAFNELMSDQQALSGAFGSLNDVMKNKLIKQLNKYQVALSAIPKSLVAASGAIKGFKFSLNLAASALKFGTKLFQSLASTILGLINLIGGAGIGGLAGVFKFVLKALREGLEEFNRNLLEVMQATEAMRASFGDLGEGIGQAAMNMAKGANIVNKIGGRFQDQLNLMREALTGVGAAFEMVTSKMTGRQQREMGNMAIVLTRGLGLTAEQLETLGRNALVTGESLSDLSKRFIQGIKSVASFVGISKKSIAKDVAAMLDNVEDFGTQTVETAIAATGRLRSLGLEMRNIVGITKKFDTFKDAAISVGLLNQVFDVQLDAYKMMNEQDPTKRIEMLRTAFFRTGQVFRNLPRQQQQYLSQLTGLDVKTADLVFSQKNMGKSYADIQKQAEKARTPQEKMVDALSKMQDTLAKILTYFKPYLSFTEAISDGIRRGLGLSKEGTKLFGNYQFTLQGVMNATKDLVAWSLKHVPGLGKVWEGFTSLLDPRKSKLALSILSSGFKRFIAETGGTDWSGMFSSFGMAFDAWFGEGAWEMIRDGTKEFGQMLLNGLTAAVNWVAPKLANIVQVIADWFKDTKNQKLIFNQDTWYGPLLQSLTDAWDVLKEPLFDLLANAFDWAVTKIKTSDIWKSLFAGANSLWEENKVYIIGGLIAWFTGPAIILAFSGVISRAIVSALMSGVAEGLATGSVMKGLTASFGSLFGRAAPFLGKALGGLFSGPVMAVAGAGLAGYGAGTALDKWLGISDWIADFNPALEQTNKLFSEQSEKLKTLTSKYQSFDYLSGDAQTELLEKMKALDTKMRSGLEEQVANELKLQLKRGQSLKQAAIEANKYYDFEVKLADKIKAAGLQWDEAKQKQGNKIHAIECGL